MNVYGGMLGAGTKINSVTSSKITISAGATSGAPIGATVVASPSPSAGDNIKFGSKEIVITDNIIQQGGGWGIDLTGMRSARVANNFLDGNGRNVPGTGAIRVNGSGHVTICSNTISQSALASIVSLIPGVPPLYYASHVFFSGADDSISLCGNVYLPIVSSGSNSTYATNTGVLLNPDYTFGADPASILTNISITDNLAPQMIDTYSPDAYALLKGSVRTLPTPGYITGLTLSNDASSGTTVDIAAGSATDSTGTAQIALATQCKVNLAGAGGIAGANGPGGIDTGTAAASTTYYFFVISGPGGTNPSCMASTTLAPTFLNLPPSQTIQLTGQTTAGSNVIFNLSPGTAISAPNGFNANPLGGIMAGDPISGSNFTSSTIQSLSPFRLIGVPATISSTNTATAASGFAGVLPGMSVAAVTVPMASAGIPPGTVAGASCGSTCINLMPPSGFISAGAIVLTFSGNYTLTLGGTTTASSSAATTVAVYPGRYRLAGALYTQGAGPPTGTLVGFKQDGETFYLTTPVADLETSTCSVSTATTKCALNVPCGRGASTCGGSPTCPLPASVNAVAVQAFGRMVAGSNSVLISSPDQGLASASIDLTTAPGFAGRGLNSGTAYPFLLYTNTCGQVQVQANTGTASVNGVTDGWIFQR